MTTKLSGEIGPDACLHITLGHGMCVTIGSDGSGGPHSSDARLRRVGWSWAALNAAEEVFASIADGVTGKVQTVPRSELVAAVHFVTHCTIEDGCLVELYIDNAYVVNTLYKVLAGWRPGAKTVHGDLWEEMCSHERGMGYLRLGILRIYKIKAHLSRDEAIARGHSGIAWVANQAADDLADKAAAEASYGVGDVRLVQKLDALANDVCKRLVAVGKFIVEHRTIEERVQVARVQPLRTRLDEVGRRNGHLLVYHAQGSTGGVECRTCGIHSRLREAGWWLAEPCRGAGCRQGHAMEVVHGLSFCKICGRYTRNPDVATKGLKQVCSGVPGKHARRFLRRVCAKPPLPPYGVKVWPDGTKVEDVTAGRKQLRRRATRTAARTPSCAGGGDRDSTVLGENFLAGFQPNAAKRSRRPSEIAAADAQIVQIVQPSGTTRRARFIFDRDPGSPAREEGVSKAALQFAALRARIRAKEAANQGSPQQPP